MELKDRKRINNKLPGFAGGFPGLEKAKGISLGFTGPLSIYDIQMPEYVSPWLKSKAGRELLSSVTPILDKKWNITGLERNIKAPIINRAYPSAKDNFKNFGGQAIQQGIAFAGDIMNSFGNVKSADDMLMNAGRTNGSVNGIGYEKQNYVDEAAERDELRKENTNNILKDIGSGASFGGALGSVVPVLGTALGTGLGAAVGGLLGWAGGSSRKEKQEEQMREAQRKADRTNTYRRSIGNTEYLTQNYASQYGNLADYQLPHAKDGKDAYTSFGEIPTTPNSKTEGGEVIYNKGKQTANIIPGQPNGDTHLTMTLPSDTIITNKYGLSELAKPAAKALMAVNSNKQKLGGQLRKQTDELVKAQATDVLDKISELQLDLRHSGLLDQPKKLYAKNGKDCLPGFAKGFPSWTVDALNAGIGLYQWINANNQRIKRPYSYVANPYENMALSKLAGLRVNPYPIINQLRNQERRNIYNINRTAGLSGAQRAYANIANGLGTQAAIANMGLQMQDMNNKYVSNYASTALNAGQATRQAQQAANQYDLEYYSKAHAARKQMQQMGMYNLANAIQQGYANWWKKNQFDRMYNLYAADLDEDKRKYLNLLG